MELRSLKFSFKRLATGLIITSLVITAGFFPAQKVRAAELSPRSITLSDAHASATNVTYDLKFGLITPGTLGSIEIQFCSNSALIGDTCSPPSGINANSVVLSSQSGATGFTVFSGSTANDIILTRPPAVVSAGPLEYVLTNIGNPTSTAPLFARVLTYASSNASGASTDSGGVALALSGDISITTEVPPFLIFCLGENITGFNCATATDPFSDFGDFNPHTASAAQHQMVVATNAQNGYTAWATGTTMTSGNNTIAAMSALGPSVPGTAQFGFNLRANSSPSVGQDVQGAGVGAVLPNFNQPNQFFFHSGDALVSASDSDNYRKYTISYIVNVPANQPGGVYSTTLTYTCLANF